MHPNTCETYEEQLYVKHRGARVWVVTPALRVEGIRRGSRRLRKEDVSAHGIELTHIIRLPTLLASESTTAVYCWT